MRAADIPVEHGEPDLLQIGKGHVYAAARRDVGGNFEVLAVNELIHGDGGEDVALECRHGAIVGGI
jgi:hypothetical protein